MTSPFPTERTLNNKLNKSSSVAQRIEATELEYLQHTTEIVSKALAIRDSYTNFLAMKYKLEGEDSISFTTGQIERVTALPVPTEEELIRSYAKAVTKHQLTKEYAKVTKNEKEAPPVDEGLPDPSHY